MFQYKKGQSVLLKTYDEMERESLDTIGLRPPHFGIVVKVFDVQEVDSEGRTYRDFIADNGFYYEKRAIKRLYKPKPKFVLIKEKT